jgi:hypothetical protein
MFDVFGGEASPKKFTFHQNHDFVETSISPQQNPHSGHGGASNMGTLGALFWSLFRRRVSNVRFS